MTPLGELRDRVAVVTGGAGGIGRGLVEALLEEGVRVVMADVEREVLDQTVDALSSRGDITGIVTDVSDFDSVDTLAAEVFERHGACHLLFNNAGVTSGGGGKPWEQEANDWKWCFGVNVFGVANGVLAFVPRMISSGEPGVIVNTSSGDGGIAPVPYASVYASSKAAISCFTEALAHQLIDAGTDLRAAIFYPSGGLLDTGLWTAQRNRPAELARLKPRPPAPGTTFAEFKAQLEAAGRSAEVMDLLELGRFVVRGVRAGTFIIGHDLDDAGALLHARADAIAKGELPPEREALMEAGRYTVISADCHAGADLLDYKPYLASQWHDDFDGWAAAYVNPFADLLAATAYRNWDSERRLAEHEADGIVAEVLFPNTIPPFFTEGNLVALPPTDAEYDRRWAGLQAHNRWLADFCAAAPGRRAGILQIFLNRMDDALAEIRWAKDHLDVFGGVLLPAVAPNSHLPPLWDPHYEPLWQICEELDVPLNVHSGSGLPAYGDHEAARAMMLIELPWFAHRPVWHLIFSGVLERHPGLRIALTEQGVAWLPRGLETLDWFYRRMTTSSSAEASFFGAVAASLTMTPSEYFRRNFWVGASFLRPVEAPMIGDIGVDRIMWGSDYPHSEGSYPYSREALRAAFSASAVDDVRAMVTTNAAGFYGFDVAPLEEIGERSGPLVAEVARPLPPEEYPPRSTCNAFENVQTARAW